MPTRILVPNPLTPAAHTRDLTRSGVFVVFREAGGLLDSAVRLWPASADADAAWLVSDVVQVRPPVSGLAAAAVSLASGQGPGVAWWGSGLVAQRQACGVGNAMATTSKSHRHVVGDSIFEVSSQFVLTPLRSRPPNLCVRNRAVSVRETFFPRPNFKYMCFEVIQRPPFSMIHVVWPSEGQNEAPFVFPISNVGKVKLFIFPPCGRPKRSLER